MTTTQLLFLKIAEEAAEIVVECSKAMQFGKDEKKPDQPLTNAERVVTELNDLMAVVEMAAAAGLIPADWQMPYHKARKKAAVRKYAGYAVQCGQLEGEIDG